MLIGVAVDLPSAEDEKVRAEKVKAQLARLTELMQEFSTLPLRFSDLGECNVLGAHHQVEQCYSPDINKPTIIYPVRIKDTAQVIRNKNGVIWHLSNLPSTRVPHQSGRDLFVTCDESQVNKHVLYPDEALLKSMEIFKSLPHLKAKSRG